MSKTLSKDLNDFFNFNVTGQNFTVTGSLTNVWNAYWNLVVLSLCQSQMKMEFDIWFFVYRPGILLLTQSMKFTELVSFYGNISC